MTKNNTLQNIKDNIQNYDGITSLLIGLFSALPVTVITFKNSDPANDGMIKTICNTVIAGIATFVSVSITIKLGTETSIEIIDQIQKPFNNSNNKIATKSENSYQEIKDNFKDYDATVTLGVAIVFSSTSMVIAYKNVDWGNGNMNALGHILLTGSITLVSISYTAKRLSEAFLESVNIIEYLDESSTNKQLSANTTNITNLSKNKLEHKTHYHHHKLLTNSDDKMDEIETSNLECQIECNEMTLKKLNDLSGTILEETNEEEY